MFVVELVMQGVRGIRELSRVRFQSGFNLVFAGNESGKTTAVDTLQRLLFPNGGAGALEPLVSKHTPDSSRGALVVCADDGAYYRVIQDFRRLAVNLSRYNASSKEFNLLYKDWNESAQFMAGLTAGVAEDDFARVFLFRREDAAGRAASPIQDAIPAPVDRPERGAAGGEAAGKAKLARLRETLRKAEEAADAEYRYQSSKLTLDEIGKKLAALDEAERKKSEFESALADLKGYETLPENLMDMIEENKLREGQKAVDTDDLNGKLDGLKTQLEGIPSVNVLTDKLFIAGAVLGILSILAGVFVLTAEYGHYFPIGVILSLILMAFAAYNGTRRNAQRRTVRLDIEELQGELVELERNFVREGAPLEVAGARAIVPAIRKRIAAARRKGELVVYVCDAHKRNDPEFARMGWPPHAVEGTPGSAVVRALSPEPGDVVVEKRSYSGFFRTGLDGILKRVVANPSGKEMILRFAAESDIETSYAAWRLDTPIPFSIIAVRPVRAAKLSMTRFSVPSITYTCRSSQ